jgi:hypothetical protein
MVPMELHVSILFLEAGSSSEVRGAKCGAIRAAENILVQNLMII